MKRYRRGKKLVSMLLALCMAASMLPTAALAAEDTQTSQTTLQDSAEADEVPPKLERTLTTYGTETDAIAYPAEGGNIYLRGGSGSGVVSGVIGCDDTVVEANIPAEVNGMPVTFINANAFINCSRLSDIVIPDGITLIGSNAFKNCTSLTEIAIPDSVTRIDSCAFYGCSKLRSITIPENVTAIDNGTFQNCSELTSVILPQKLSSIGADAFSNCASLSSIDIPGSVIELGGGAFSGCESLTAIALPDNVSSIGMQTFRNCSALKNLVLPGNLESIDTWAFLNCVSLETITLPRSTGSISVTAFAGCTGIKRYEVEPNNSSYSSENGILYNANKTELILYPIGMESLYYELPETVQSIGDYAFAESRLLQIRIPNTVISIGSSAFEDCNELTEIKLPDSITEIGNSAFWMCTALKQITIPNGVTNIGRSAFYSSGLEYIILPATLENIGYDAFSGCNNLKDVYYAGSNEKWNEITFDNYSAVIENATIHYNSTGPVHNIVSGYCGSVGDGKNLTWMFDMTSGELVISGSGGMKSYIGSSGGSNAPWYPYIDDYGSDIAVTIETGVTSIGENAFYWCNEIKSITLPDTLIYISAQAFWSTGITEIELPEGLLTIGAYAFSQCTALKEIKIPATVTKIGRMAFNTSRGIQEIRVDENNLNYASIDGVLFSKDLQTLICCPPDYQKTVYAIPKSTIKLDEYSFNSCKNITGIAVPKSVVSIGDGATSSCINLTDIYYEGTEEEWNRIEFGENLGALSSATIHYNSTMPDDETQNEQANKPQSNITIEDVWYFSNISNITKGIDFYKKLFPELQAKELKDFNEASEGGICFGMAAGAINLNSRNCEQLSTDYWSELLEENCRTVRDIDKSDESKILSGMTAEEYIYYMQAYQLIPKMADIIQNENKNDLQGLYDAVKAYEKGGGNGVVVTMKGQWEKILSRALHAVWGIKIAEETDEVCKILVYDPNARSDWDDPIVQGDSSGHFQYLILKKNAEGEFDSWSYQLSSDITWGPGIWKYISFSTCSEDNYDDLKARVDASNDKFWAVWNDGHRLITTFRGKPRDTDALQIEVAGASTTDESSTDELLPSLFWTKNDTITIEGSENGVSAKLTGDTSQIVFTSEKNGTASLSIDEAKGGIISFNGMQGSEMTASFITVDAQGERVEVTITGIASSETGRIEKDGDHLQLYAAADIHVFVTTPKGSYEIVNDGGAGETDISLLDSNLEIPVHPHDMDFAEKVYADCSSAGTLAHWHCSICGKDFADSTGTAELTDTVIPVDPANHAGGTEIRNASEATYTHEGYTGDTYCLGCGEKIASGSVIPIKNSGNGSSGGSGSSTGKNEGKIDEPDASLTDVPLLDVPSGAWYESAVNYVYEKGIMSGTSEGIFSPDRTTTRGMIVTILWRMEDSPEAEPAAFADVAEGRYCTSAVAWAAANGIVAGYGDGTFGPDNPITREQMAAILYRYAGYKGYDVAARADISGYTDAGQVSAYAREAVQWANAEGLINGTSATTLMPGGSATRAQVAVILTRFLQQIAA